jgi:hypothetical protein
LGEKYCCQSNDLLYLDFDSPEDAVCAAVKDVGWNGEPIVESFEIICPAGNGAVKIVFRSDIKQGTSIRELALDDSGPLSQPPKENHASYQKRFKYLSVELRRFLDSAYCLAKDVHRGQVRENGEPYFNHPRRVSIAMHDELGIKDVYMHIEALLHDAPEDRLWTSAPHILLKLFGPVVNSHLKILTKPKMNGPKKFADKEALLDFYHGRLNKDNCPLVPIIVKLVDRLDNLRTLGACPRSKQIRKVRETMRHYVPLFVRIEKRYPEQARILRREFAKAIGAIKRVPGVKLSDILKA